MILTAWKDEVLPRRRYRLWFGLIVAACCALYAGLLATRGMVPTEGWYSYYAYIMNEEGAIPYVDFELLFPPLYTYLIALFTRVFGYSILALRLLGVAVFSLTGFFAYLIFEKLTSKPFFAMLSGLLAASVLQSEVVQVFYDYIRFMDLCAYIAIYCLICAVDRIERQGTIRLYEPSVLLGAGFVTLASMFKQSSGLILLIYAVIFLLFAALVFPHRGLYLKALSSMLSVVALLYGVMAVFLVSQGSFSAYVHYNFQAAVDAKGGNLLTVLFGWMSRAKGYWWVGLLGLLGAALIFGVLLGFYRLSQRKPMREGDGRTSFKLLVPVFCLSFLILFVIATLTFEPLQLVWLGAQKKFTAFLISTAVFAAVSVAAIVRRIRKKELPCGAASLCFFSGAVFVLAYAVCMSGGLTESQIALGYPLFAMIFLPTLKFRKSEWVALALSVAMLFNAGLGLERKTRHIYDWWGLQVGSLWEQTERAENVPLLNGLTMNAAYADMYEGVRASVMEYTEEGEEIFVFPHMPILYLTCERPRATETAVQWFDVSTDAAVVTDMAVLREKTPKVMILCRIDETVMTYHEDAFRGEEKSGLYQMQEFLPGFLTEYGYVADGAYEISPTYTVEVWILPTAAE